VRGCAGCGPDGGSRQSVHLELDRPLGVQEDLKSVEVSELDPFGIEIGGPNKSRIRCGVSDITLLAVCQKACLPFRPVAPCRTPSRQQQHVLEASSPSSEALILGPWQPSRHPRVCLTAPFRISAPVAFGTLRCSPGADLRRPPVLLPLQAPAQVFAPVAALPALVSLALTIALCRTRISISRMVRHGLLSSTRRKAPKNSATELAEFSWAGCDRLYCDKMLVAGGGFRVWAPRPTAARDFC
jgi:hypothetical protein